MKQLMEYVPEIPGLSPKHLMIATHITNVPGKTSELAIGSDMISGLQYINTSVIIHLHFPTKLFSVRTIRRWIVEQENFLHGNVSTLYI